MVKHVEFQGKNNDIVFMFHDNYAFYTRRPVTSGIIKIIQIALWGLMYLQLLITMVLLSVSCFSFPRLFKIINVK